MPSIDFSADECVGLLEFLEGEGSCALVHDPVFELYDLLCARTEGEDCTWELAAADAEELLEPIGDCTDGAYQDAADLLYGRLRAVCR